MAVHPNCTIITVIGGKGGVGKSVFAANFACALMHELRTHVLLIDSDGKSVGDQNVILGIKPVKTLREIASFQGSLSSQPINQLCTVHPSGLHYVGAVRGPEEQLNISAESMDKLLDFLSRHYKFIIIDLGNDLGPAQIATLQESTAIMMVTNPDVLVVTQTLRLLNELLSLTFPKDMIQLVINKVGTTGIAPLTIANQLQVNPVAIIPQDDVTAMGALQKYSPFVLSQPRAQISGAYFDAVRKLTGGTLQRLKALSRPKPSASAQTGPGPSGLNAATSNSTGNPGGPDPFSLLKIRVHNELIRTVDLKKLLTDSQQDENKEKEIREKTKREISQIIDREAPNLSRDERSKVIKQVLEEALGLGPLEDLLASPDISEIMVNGHDHIFVEQSGKVILSPVTFTTNDHLRLIIQRIVTPLGRQINQASPYVDARLKDGSRVNAIIEPLAIDGPALTIRKFKKGGVSPEKYLSYGSMSQNMLDLLKICVENGLNIVISGGTGSGKTTLLNMLSSFIPSNERIITIEDAAELQLQQEHVVRLETRPPSMEGSNAITIRDLIKNSLRMRPDRIVVGECRDGAALDMLQAMNTGHDGSMTTTHANSPRECVARLETLSLMAGMDLPARAIREQIASAVNLIVQVSRLSDGARKILSITEVQGMQGEVITLAEIFKFKETGYDKNRKILGQFQATGTIPSFIQKLSDKGITIPREIFSNDSSKALPKTTTQIEKQSSTAIPKMPTGMPTGLKKSG